MYGSGCKIVNGQIFKKAANLTSSQGANGDSPNNNIDLFAGGIIVDGLAGSLTPPNELHVSDFPYNQRNQRMRRNSTGKIRRFFENLSVNRFTFTLLHSVVKFSNEQQILWL